MEDLKASTKYLLSLVVNCELLKLCGREEFDQKFSQVEIHEHHQFRSGETNRNRDFRSSLVTQEDQLLPDNYDTTVYLSTLLNTVQNNLIFIYFK